MRIAIYNNSTNYILLGFLLDYFITSKTDYIIYSLLDQKLIEWNVYYEQIFGITIKYNDINLFDINNFDLVYLLSKDDSLLNSPENQHKIIYFDNENIDCNILMKIDYRFNIIRPFNNWLMPCYKGILQYEKEQLINNITRKRIICINENIQNIEQLEILFDNFEEIDFYIFGSTIDTRKKLYQNINIYEIYSPLLLIHLLKKGTHILCLDNKQIENTKITDSIFLAYIFGCQLIIPKYWNLFYDLKSVITYTDKIIIDYNINLVYNEINSLVRYKNKVLDKSINIKFPYYILKEPKSWFSLIIKELRLPLPNIFVETGTYLGHGIKNVINDFREVHSIELKEEFYKNAVVNFQTNRNVFLHLGDSGDILWKLIYEFNEPVLFFLDAHYSGGETAFGREEEKGVPIIRELSALGKRQFMDIIIIDDMRLFGKSSYSGIENDPIYPLTQFDWTHITLEHMLKTYNRQCIHYMCPDVDRLILIPQR